VYISAGAVSDNAANITQIIRPWGSSEVTP